MVVPRQALAGGHYAVIFYSPVAGTLGAPGGEFTGATAINLNVGTLVYLTVSGDIKEEGRVLRMTAPSFQEYGPVKIETEILNLSDVHIKPTGAIRIYDWLGKLKATLKLKEQNIFPSGTRVYENTWQQKWGLGKYKAQLQASFGSQGKVLLATVFFWIVPWRAIAVTILTVVLAILLLLYLRRPKEIKK